MKSVLLVAAERREFDGIRKRLGPTVERKDLGLRFACEATREGDRWLMIANGPGRELAGQALSESVMRKVLREQVDGESVIRKIMQRENVKAIISTGFAARSIRNCGSAILLCRSIRSSTPHGHSPGAPCHTCDRVAVTRAEKHSPARRRPAPSPWIWKRPPSKSTRPRAGRSLLLHPRRIRYRRRRFAAGF